MVESVAASDAARDGIDDAVAALAARPHVAVALDFDGVLAPLGSDPMAVRMVDGADAVLARIAAAPGMTLALVSGRRLPDILRLARPPRGTLLATSHGAEHSEVTGEGEDGPLAETTPAELDDDEARLLERLDDGLSTIASSASGVWVERKPYARALHTRQAAASDAEAAERAALAGPATLPGTHTITGKAVVEIAVVSVTKADGVAWVRETAARRAGVPDSEVALLFAGDDRTDEDALRALRPGDLGVKVGAGETAARLRVPDEAAVVDLLRRLLEAR
ncbi:MAG: trehalose-phosphatase [Micrococcales bacterium 73-15]|uniref:trehalose-phosphatase n=1 Tax=Salana multivorans TaxID=120377 RepID=UPI000966D20C|nr:trehalose-phosphatase [Salana multivorans]OJX97500.1 MAG: trehalose-phosphatase [Micrococcales bacterium 73-15]